MGVKMGWIQIKMGHPLARNGAALAPFRANGAHPSSNHLHFAVSTSCMPSSLVYKPLLALSSMMRMLSKYVRTSSRMRTQMQLADQKALRRLSEARDCIQRSLALPR